MSAKDNIVGGILGIAWLVATILGLVIHVWTIVIAYLASGIVAAVVTLLFPVLSQAYWFFKVGSNAGYDTDYCIAILAYVGLMVSGLISILIMDRD